MCMCEARCILYSVMTFFDKCDLGHFLLKLLKFRLFNTDKLQWPNLLASQLSVAFGRHKRIPITTLTDIGNKPSRAY